MSEKIKPKIGTAEVAELLGVCADALKYIRDLPGFPRAYRYGPRGKRLYDAAEIEAWREGQRERKGGATHAA